MNIEQDFEARRFALEKAIEVSGELAPAAQVVATAEVFLPFLLAEPMPAQIRVDAPEVAEASPVTADVKCSIPRNRFVELHGQYTADELYTLASFLRA